MLPTIGGHRSPLHIQRSVSTTVAPIRRAAAATIPRRLGQYFDPAVGGVTHLLTSLRWAARHSRGCAGWGISLSRTRRAPAAPNSRSVGTGPSAQAGAGPLVPGG